MVKRSAKLSSFLLGFIYFSVCSVIGVYSGYCADHYFDGNLILSYLIILGLTFAAYLPHILIHEFGHFVFGKLTGYRFKSFRVFGLMWQRDGDGKIRFYRYHLAGTGGQCLMAPPEMKNGDMPYVLYNLGGVFFNLLLGLAGMLTAGLLSEGAPGEIYGKILYILGFAFALVNALPLPGVSNDGSNCLSLSKSVNARKSFWIQMNGVVLLSEGKRVREFPEEWFVKPTREQMRNPIEATMAVYICDRLMDTHDFRAAQTYIDELLGCETGILQIHLQLLRCNALYCELIGHGDSERVKAYRSAEWEAFCKSMKTNPTVLRTQYAYEKLYRKDEAQAAKYLAQFEKTAKTFPYPCEIETERELIAIADEKAASFTDPSEKNDE